MWLLLTFGVAIVGCIADFMDVVIVYSDQSATMCRTWSTAVRIYWCCSWCTNKYGSNACSWRPWDIWWTDGKL